MGGVVKGQHAWAVLSRHGMHAWPLTCGRARARRHCLPVALVIERGLDGLLERSPQGALAEHEHVTMLFVP